MAKFERRSRRVVDDEGSDLAPAIIRRARNRTGGGQVRRLPAAPLRGLALESLGSAMYFEIAWIHRYARQKILSRATLEL